MHHRRYPAIYSADRIRSFESFRRDAYHGVVKPIEFDRTADDRRVAAETALPCAVTEHDGRVRPRRTVFFGQKRATDRGLDAEQIEIISRDDHPGDLLWLASARV